MISYSCQIKTTLLCKKITSQFPEQSESIPNIKNLGDRKIKQLLNLVYTTKYHDMAVSRRSIICVSLRFQQITVTVLLRVDKS